MKPGCVRIRACAKINLFLRVTKRRADGYHDLSTLMAPIDLCDQLEIAFSGHGNRIACDHPDVPEDETNLVHRAATLFCRALKEKTGDVPVPGVSIRIHKHIPVGGGLGGGSSDAAATLVALNAWCSRPFSTKELAGLGLCLGADVPFFVYGCPALATGVGEQLEPRPDLPRYYLVLASPGVPASTAKVFRNLENYLTSRAKYTMSTGSNMLVPAEQGETPLGHNLDGSEELLNDLEGSASGLYPEIGSTRKEMGMLLQRNVYMSGSGSSLFALYSRAQEAREGYERLKARWAKTQRSVFLSRVLSKAYAEG